MRPGGGWALTAKASTRCTRLTRFLLVRRSLPADKGGNPSTRRSVNGGRLMTFVREPVANVHARDGAHTITASITPNVKLNLQALLPRARLLSYLQRRRLEAI